MKKAQVAGLLLLSCLAWGAKAADYPLIVHVRSSHLFHECDSVQFKVACGNNLHLDVVVDNKKYELDGGMADGLLRTGDYPARLVKDNAPGAFMERREFELLFPDGTGHKFAKRNKDAPQALAVIDGEGLKSSNRGRCRFRSTRVSGCRLRRDG
jgi:hypothetical protein